MYENSRYSLPSILFVTANFEHSLRKSKFYKDISFYHIKFAQNALNPCYLDLAMGVLRTWVRSCKMKVRQGYVRAQWRVRVICPQLNWLIMVLMVIYCCKISSLEIAYNGQSGKFMFNSLTFKNITDILGHI